MFVNNNIPPLQFIFFLRLLINNLQMKTYTLLGIFAPRNSFNS